MEDGIEKYELKSPGVDPGMEVMMVDEIDERPIVAGAGETNMEPEIVVTMVNLGGGNAGQIGGKEVTAESRQKVVDEVSDPESHAPIDCLKSCCVDGGIKETRNDKGEYTSQLAGTIVVSESAAELSTNPDASPLSSIVEAKTRAVVDDGIEVVMHGDSVKHRSGCAANTYLKQVLAYNGKNVDVVAPISVAVAEESDLKLEDYGLSIENVIDSIVLGASRADSGELFDIDSTDTVEVAVKNGAKYVELVRKHNEGAVIVATDADKTFDGTKYSSENTDENGLPKQYFVATIGAYVKQAFERGEKHGIDKSVTALNCLSVIAFNVGVAKYIGNDNLEAALMSTK